jgi:putative oxidoreductase
MEISPSFLAAWTPRIQGLLRIVAGFLFLQHGTKKLFGLPGMGMSEGVQLFSLMGSAGVLELVGGLLVLIGLFTRPTAFVLSGLMAVAYFMAHAPKDLLPILNRGELAVIYCFVFLYFAAAGAGAFSIDERRRKE